MNQNITLTGKASIDRPWMKYYPQQYFGHIKVPECTLAEYLQNCCPGMDVPAIHFYGKEILWSTIFEMTEKVARSLRKLGFGEGDQIPVFLQNVPEFFPLLLAAEKIGASILCRDNTLEENVYAVNKSGAKVIFAHDYLNQEEADAYLSGTTEKIVILPALNSADLSAVPDYIMDTVKALYTGEKAQGSAIISWNEFLALGENFEGVVEAERDVDRPLYRAYTSGSTGPSKQVIHSAHNMMGVLVQMNFYGSSADGSRPTWMVAALTPCLIAVVVAMDILPLASNKLLILSPYCKVEDMDLEFMRYKPNCWPLIPMFIEEIMRSKRIPEDFDISFFTSAGAGSEAFNNNQLKRAQTWLAAHGFKNRFTIGYGCSEACSNLTLPLQPHPFGNGNSCIPMPLITAGIFKPGTDEELGYNEEGEICVVTPGVMLGYDDPAATAKALRRHSDGQVWLHLGDIGYMNEDGVLFVTSRGYCPRFGGGELPYFPMENKLADAAIPGIDDEFFVIVPDGEHPGYFLPYLYVVLNDGYTVDDIREAVNEVMAPHERPVEITVIPERPFFHFKTNRIGLTKEILARRKVK